MLTEADQLLFNVVAEYYKRDDLQELKEEKILNDYKGWKKMDEKRKLLIKDIHSLNLADRTITLDSLKLAENIA